MPVPLTARLATVPMKIPKAALVGHSMGGITVAKAALTEVSLIYKVIKIRLMVLIRL